MRNAARRPVQRIVRDWPHPAACSYCGPESGKTLLEKPDKRLVFLPLYRSLREKPRAATPPTIATKNVPTRTDSKERLCPGRPSGRRLLFHPRHDLVSRSTTPSLETSSLASLPKVHPYLRLLQVGQLRQPDVTHRVTGSLQDSGAILEFRYKGNAPSAR